MRPFTPKRLDQEYIVIKPRVLFLNETVSTGEIQITCRQLPTSANNLQMRLTILRRPVQAVGENADHEKLADVLTSGAATTFGGGNPNAYVASGDALRKLVLTIVKASCEDAKYTYLCRSQQNQTVNWASDRIAVAVVPPVVTLTVSPVQSEYSQGDNLTLTCSTTGAIGLTSSPATLGRWVWEYNDLGPWLQAPDEDVGKAKLTSRGCFQKSTPTKLTVRVKDLKSCSRRFRCYVTADVSRAVDDAQEHEVSMGFKCDETSSILRTDPALAIVGVSAVLIVFVAFTFCVFQLTRRTRRQLKKDRRKQAAMMILIPMIQAQRDRLLMEKRKKHVQRSGKQLKPVMKPTKALIRLNSTTSEEGTRYRMKEEKSSNVEDERRNKVIKDGKSVRIKDDKFDKIVKGGKNITIIVKERKRVNKKDETGDITTHRKRAEKIVKTKSGEWNGEKRARVKEEKGGKMKREEGDKEEEQTGGTREKQRGSRQKKQTSNQKEKRTSIQVEKQTGGPKETQTKGSKEKRTSSQTEKQTITKKEEREGKAVNTSPSGRMLAVRAVKSLIRNQEVQPSKKGTGGSKEEQRNMEKGTKTAVQTEKQTGGPQEGQTNSQQEEQTRGQKEEQMGGKKGERISVQKKEKEDGKAVEKSASRITTAVQAVKSFIAYREVELSEKETGVPEEERRDIQMQQQTSRQQEKLVVFPKAEQTSGQRREQTNGKKEKEAGGRLKGEERSLQEEEEKQIQEDQTSWQKEEQTGGKKDKDTAGRSKEEQTRMQKEEETMNKKKEEKDINGGETAPAGLVDLAMQAVRNIARHFREVEPSAVRSSSVDGLFKETESEL